MATLTHLTVEDLAAALQQGLKEAVAERAAWLRIEASLPFGSEHAWTDDYGAPRTVHLPVQARSTPTAEMPAEELHEDDLVLAVKVPPGTSGGDSSALARALYVRLIEAAHLRFGSAAGPADLPQVPEGLMPIVRSTLG